MMYQFLLSSETDAAGGVSGEVSAGVSATVAGSSEEASWGTASTGAASGSAAKLSPAVSSVGMISSSAMVIRRLPGEGVDQLVDETREQLIHYREIRRESEH